MKDEVFRNLESIIAKENNGGYIAHRIKPSWVKCILKDEMTKVTKLETRSDGSIDNAPLTQNEVLAKATKNNLIYKLCSNMLSFPLLNPNFLRKSLSNEETILTFSSSKT